ncbi:hypothetical protein D9758_011809 [Tetrapyrgos nigripes]|uniref:PH domain-containing protein n=1 Tax=Tetrapyrgos nigripes TaxID=182062 RepID=A0A8H5CKH4_9AGAR|nr:hypothetical protein D9758_011809 [Tetrapyrgos nigripes]
MEDPYPRSQSVMQTRGSGFQSKASKILQKVTHIRDKIRLASRSGNFKSEDDSLNRSPYMRQTRSMDIDRHTKPYMSQPLLTIPNMLDPVSADSHDADGYSSNSSPHHSPARSAFDRDATAASPTTNTSTNSTSRPRSKSHTHNHSRTSSNPKQGMSKTTANADGLPNRSIPRALMPSVAAATGIALGHGGRSVGVDGLPVSDELLFLRAPSSSSRSTSAHPPPPAKEKDPVVVGPPRTTSQSNNSFNRRYWNQLGLAADSDSSAQIASSELDKSTRSRDGTTEPKSQSHSPKSATVSGSSSSQSHSQSTSVDPTSPSNSSSSKSNTLSRPSFLSSPSSTSVQSVGQASVHSTATSSSEASFKSCVTSDGNGSDLSSGSSSVSRPGHGTNVFSTMLAAGVGQGASVSTVTITQSGSDMKQAQGHGRSMKEKELPSSPNTSTATTSTTSKVDMGKVSTSMATASSSPSSSTPPAVPSKDAHISRKNSPSRGKTNTGSSYSTPASSSSAAASASTQTSHSSSPSPPTRIPPPIPDHHLQPSPPPLKQPSTSPAAPILPSQFTSFASMVEANPGPSSTSTTSTSADSFETTTPTQASHSLPISIPSPIPIPTSSSSSPPTSSSSSPSSSWPAQHTRAVTTQAVSPSTPSSSVPRPLSSTLPRPSTSQTPSGPTRRPTVPRLTTPLPGHRFSLQMTEGEAMARLSPSIIIRQPVLPILNLPKLGETSSGGESQNEGNTTRRPMTSQGLVGRSTSMIIGGSGTSGVKLKHMPALPMAGTSREATGREEEDTDSEESEDDDDDDEDNDNVETNENDDDDDGDGDGETDEVSGQSSERTQQEQQAQAQEKGGPLLPSFVDFGKFDMGSMFERKQNVKGKEREKDSLQTDSSAMKTPIVGTGGINTPVPGGPSAIKTPRYGHTGQQDYFSARRPDTSSSLSSALTPAPAISIPVPSPGRPTLYKHASRSMIDIPGFGVGTSSSPASSSVTPSSLKPQPQETGKDGVLDGTSGIKKKKSKDWLGRKKSRDLKEEAKLSEGQQQQQTSIESGSSKSKHDQAPVPSSTNRDDLILEEPRRLGGAAIAAAAANLTSSAPGAHESSSAAVHAQTPSQAHTQEAGAAIPLTSIRRRRSMPSFTASSPPPPYPAFPLKCHSILEIPLGSYELPPSTPSLPSAPSRATSRFEELQRLLQQGTLTGEEGNEKLPPYTNDIYLRAIMPRKMEFIRPGAQAKDRKWRRVICELHGTVFRVYRCPPELSGTGKVADWWERKVGVGDMSVGEGVGGGVLSSGTISVASSGNPADEQRRDEERERARREKLEGEAQGSGQMHTSIRLPSTPRSPSQNRLKCRRSNCKGSLRSIGVARKTLVRSLHNGSDLPPTPRSANPPRSSFNIPRPSFGASSSSDIGTSANSSMISMTPATSNQSLSLSVPNSASTSSTSSSLAPPQPAPSLRSTSTTRSRASSRAPPPAPNYPPGVSCPAPDKTDLIKAYTLQNAESGLGNDYVKRRNVIRVRLEGEQFLLQAKDVAEVVIWIEGLHAATNIALDLDERPMPRGPMFPRRRRRRPRRTETGTGTGNNGTAGSGNASNSNDLATVT